MPRRLYLYWILLLVPTLLAGAVAWHLLRREQALLRIKSTLVDEARRQALAARTRLVAENLDLLAGDVENAVLDTLAEIPAARLPDFLARWPQENPLVRTAFLCRPDGTLLLPAAATPSESARGFRRRFEALLRTAPPWSPPVTTDLAAEPGPAATASPAKSQAAPPFTSGSVILSAAPSSARAAADTSAPDPAAVRANTLPVQSARRDVQQLARAALNSANLPVSATTAESSSPRTEAATASASSGRETRRVSTPPPVPAPAVTPSPAPFSFSSSLSSPPAQASPPLPESRGWQSVTLSAHRHLLGWLRPAGPADTPVRGVELESSALFPRLHSLLPTDLAPGESFVLRDEQHALRFHTGAAAPRTATPALRLPLGATLLRGWSLEAYLAPPDYATGLPGDDRAFFLIGALLVGIFAVAILAGGSLLLLQARASALEALRKTSFVANVSHEFKTPLTTIRLYAELLEQQRVADPARRADYLRTIGRETQRLARLVNNVLDFSRLEQGRKRYRLETFDLVAAVHAVLDTQRPRLAEAGLALQVAPSASAPAPADPTAPAAPAPLLVHADRDALEQILLNLLDNACKYAAAGGELTLTVLPPAAPRAGARDPAADHAAVLVADRGPGVPADQRERIFEKFHRVDDRLTAEQSGAGLGLSIARQLARGQGGDLACLAREGGGAVFRLHLPLPPSPSAAASAPVP